jgi:hypothetical protein
LFLHEGDGRLAPTVQRAAQSGFRVLAAPWFSCEARNGSILVREGREILANGCVVEAIDRIVVAPTFIAVLASNPSTIARGRELALESGAYWSHCAFTETGRSVDLGLAELFHACVAFSGRPPSLRILDEIADPEAVRAMEQRLAKLRADLSSDVLLHRVLAPCSIVRREGKYVIADPITNARSPDTFARFQSGIDAWLRALQRRNMAAPILVPLRADASTSGWNARFPAAFDTPDHIETELVEGASFVFLDPQLQSSSVGETDQCALRHALARRRSGPGPQDSTRKKRFVAPGVGRAAVVPDLKLRDTAFRDFTALGIGLTQYSEGGFIDIGRKIDGKTGLPRALHRRQVAERLEQSGCRAARVVAILSLPNETIELPNDTIVPAVLVVRAFRCEYRVKQLDPLICLLHSIQHTPLVNAYIAMTARRMAAQRLDGARRGLEDDELLIQALENYGPAQASLRQLVASPSRRIESSGWLGLVRQVRLDAISSYAPILLDTAIGRLAEELNRPPETVSKRDYLEWFAASMGRQLARWRRLRFLHDYHHPGTSRWESGYLQTLGENNVTLLAEFPDLDSGIFVDDEESYHMRTLQLSPDDVALLRARFDTFHNHDLQSAETIVRTLAGVLSADGATMVDAAHAHFRESYDRS